jgi:hypothetical protein
MEALRARLQPALAVPGEASRERWEGWRFWLIDADALLAPVPGIRLKAGFRLQAVVERESCAGCGCVWAWPPGAAPVGIGSLAEPPPGALRAVEAFTTDGSARALLEAALLLRELDEVGAFWHAATWSTHRIVDRLPDRSWSATTRMPDDLCPRVQRSPRGDEEVIFFTFTEREMVRLVGHLDARASGREDMPRTAESVTFATAGHGWIP